MSNLPQDPVILLSFINTRLRDVCADFSRLCEEMDADENEIKEKLRAIGYEYDAESGQFR